jgi:hypothetical protein
MQARAGNVGEAVKNVSMDLWDWSKNILGDLEKRIKRARRTLEECRKNVINGQNVAREAVLSYKLERLEYQRDLYILAPKSTRSLVSERRSKHQIFSSVCI